MKIRDLRFDMFTRRGGTSCVHVARKLQQYLDGDLDAATRERISGHLAVCRRCGLDEQAYRDISHALATRGDLVDQSAIGRLRAFAVDLSNRGTPAPEE